MHKTEMKSDYQWLDNWSSRLVGKRILELGCGSGIDTATIAQLAESVVACDLAPVVEHSSAAKILALDHSKPLPFGSEFDVVVASLSLHYFDWITTKNIVAEISRVLVDDGFLLCRVNSNQDINYGARGYPKLESGLFDVGGMSKRFFDKTSILDLFSGDWTFIDLEHKSIDRYQQTKTVWELGAVKE